ncbi:hypothetical protein, partial [Pseudopedobacter sp.]|uniref:hypothetical protein n=1 Tax=Pseudopedobacter sp. TaxID=1936787 RepID=UPI00333F5AF3
RAFFKFIISVRAVVFRSGYCVPISLHTLARVFRRACFQKDLTWAEAMRKDHYSDKSTPFSKTFSGRKAYL